MLGNCCCSWQSDRHLILLVSCTILSTYNKIKWIFDENPQEPNDNEAILIASVDGTHCRINEPRNDPNTQYYSYKHNGPGLTYELGLALHEDRLVWINGPFKAGEPDIAVFRKPGGLGDMIPPGRKVIADKGYRGEPDKISTPNPHDSVTAELYKRRARARHETFNKQIKAFKILGEQFRHELSCHKIAFEAVCVLIQYDIELETTLLEI
jgi:DDE superfamily endonuclease